MEVSGMSTSFESVSTSKGKRRRKKKKRKRKVRASQKGLEEVARAREPDTSSVFDVEDISEDMLPLEVSAMSSFTAETRAQLGQAPGGNTGEGSGSGRIAQLEKENARLAAQNRLLHVKVELLMDMLTTERLDALAREEEHLAAQVSQA